MKLSLFSNYLNAHQIPFCLEMIKRCEGFAFVALAGLQIPLATAAAFSA